MNFKMGHIPKAESNKGWLSGRDKLEMNIQEVQDLREEDNLDKVRKSQDLEDQAEKA